MEVLHACTRTHASNGATERGTDPPGAFFTDGYDDHNGTLQFANGAIDDRGRRQWPLHALHWGRLRRLDCHCFYWASLPHEHGLLRLQPGAGSLALVDGAHYL